MLTETDYVIVVEALNQQGLASDLTGVISLLGCDIQSFSAFRRADGVTAEARIYLVKTSQTQRTRIQRELEKLPYVTSVDIISTRLLPPIQQLASNTWAQKPNPYGPKLAEGARFYGREVEIQRISSLLNDRSQSATILLWGQKRIGKTSLLLHLLEEQSQEVFLPIYIDMQAFRDGGAILFLYHLMTRIFEMIKERASQPIPNISIPQLSRLRRNSLAQFDRFMTQIQEIIQDHPLVVILDEFQCLCSLREDVVDLESIFSRLHRYSQQGNAIHLILSGGGLANQLTSQCDMTSLFNITYDEKLSSLEAKAARQLIKSGLVKVGQITEEAVDYLLEITNCHPYYLQLLCSKLFQELQEKRHTITRELASESAKGWISMADNSRFQHLWEAIDTTSTQRNKVILSAIAQLTNKNHKVEHASLVDVVGSLIPEADLGRALEDLVDLGVLKRDYFNYTIAFELFALWLRQHLPLDWVAKETHWA